MPDYRPAAQTTASAEVIDALLNIVQLRLPIAAKSEFRAALLVYLDARCCTHVSH